MSNQVRCINRERNKVQYFSKHLVDNPTWRKHTGFEPQLLCDEIKETLQPLTEQSEIVEPETKPKRKYTKRQNT